MFQLASAIEGTFFFFLRATSASRSNDRLQLGRTYIHFEIDGPEVNEACPVVN